ncbi:MULTISPECIES: ABC transporter permease [Enterococcus]|uniref:ABC transporter permease n=1 Tax=Enterococcus alishanensis TaxID=1303817 RepID=A0ABS6TEC1_9ENTE|nr:ABC transporter permease [Enterococcus alishanensis]MBV7391278.1 ABC transporter permease [Enterococcus alishanensis]
MIDGLINYLSDNSSYIISQLFTHLYISIVSVVLTFLIGFPIGIFLSDNKKIAGIVIGIINVIQTIPSIGMLTILLILLGLGKNTVIATVILYSLLPIVSNTYVGLNNVDPTYVDSAKGVGMSRFQILLMVKIPLALPVILAGVRNALVIAVGITTIGSFVGAGGLGDIILRGINITEGGPIILVGAILCAFVALFLDRLFAWIIK